MDDYIEFMRPEKEGRRRSPRDSTGVSQNFCYVWHIYYPSEHGSSPFCRQAVKQASVLQAMRHLGSRTAPPAEAPRKEFDALMVLAEPPHFVTRQVIILPGAFISPFAYSPLARDLARRGYPSFILRLPLNMGEI